MVCHGNLDFLQRIRKELEMLLLGCYRKRAKAYRLFQDDFTATDILLSFDPIQGLYRNKKKNPGLFKDFTFFSGFIFLQTVTQLILLIRRISFPIGTVNTFPLRAHCFCLILALSIVFAGYFHFCLSEFPLCKVSLTVAFDLCYMYLNRIQWLH